MVLSIYFQHEIGARLVIQWKAAKNKWKFIDVGMLRVKHGEEVAQALLGFHAYSGCDTVSGMCGKGKKTFFKVLVTNAEFHAAMIRLGENLEVDDELIEACEHGLCVIYGHGACHDINQVRYDMLSKGAESHQIPPTPDAHRLHVMRANYQAYIWKHSIDGQFVAPTPNGHGWVIVDNKIDIVWMTKDPAPKALLDLISCKTCKKCDTR